MSGKVMVRLFFASSCGSGCGCGPNKDVAALELVAEKLVKKFGVENLDFEAYAAIDLKAYPYLRKAAGSDGKIALPVLSVDETVLAPGTIPSYSEIEKAVAKCLKVI
jgi:hypothetical protein